VGEVLARTLRFCDCPAGEERQRQDAEFPAREIARVHVNLQSRMAAAAHPCMADAIQACEIEDDGQTLRIVVPKFYKIFIHEGELEAILLKLGEKRALDRGRRRQYPTEARGHSAAAGEGASRCCANPEARGPAECSRPGAMHPLWR
jgi:hypothetical protein